MINTSRLRRWIGWLGMLLPWIIVALIQYFPASISITWYTNACTPFMIILGAAGILLMCYNGYDFVDDILNTCAGVCAMGVCLFPCWGPGYLATDPVGTFMIPTNISDKIHFGCAVAFFGILAYNSFFQFTKSSGDMTRNKKIRNIIYRVCGVGMILSFGMLILPSFEIRTWLMETIALFFFGVSWLTKANYYPWLFADKK